MSVSLALLNAKVWTGDKSPARCEAIAVQGDKIVAVGRNEEIKALVNAKTKIVDGSGYLAIPGFNDSHAHFLLGGRHLLSIDLRPAFSREEMASMIAARTRTLQQGQWLVGGNWDHEQWPGRTLPVKEDIDPYTPSTPVFVTRLDLHMGLANSAALRLAGITAATHDPPGGAILRDCTGEPTGILKDAAMDFIRRAMPEHSLKESVHAVAKASTYAASLGITSLQDMSLGDDWENWEIFQSFRGTHELKVRLCARMPVTVWRRWENLLSNPGDEWLKMGGVKGFVDGSLGSSTALFYTPYDDDPENTGLSIQSSEKLADQIAAADRAGLQPAIHAIGDKANGILLDIFADVKARNGPRDRRCRIEHAQHLVAADIGRMAGLGVIASVQPYHAIDDGRWLEKRLGPERAKMSYPFRSLITAGVVTVFGSDWPVAPLSPLLGIHAAVTRDIGDSGHPQGWHPEQRISVEQAVQAYTSASAYGEFTEAVKGTIAPGKFADFTLLSRNIFSIPSQDIAAAEVLCTVCGGRIVHEK